jgi:pimeloyl-ACP methyl ester carboxylesterase
MVGGITGYMGFLDFLGLSRAPLLHVAVDEGRGPAVVLLHGIASSSVTFDNVVPLIREHHRVIAIDLLGFGQSPKPVTSNYTLEEHVAALKRTIRSLNIRGRTTVVGHSLGALISARFAAQNPSVLSHLVLVAPPVYLPGATVLDPIERLQMDAYRKLYDYMRSNRAFTQASARALSKLLPIKNAIEVNSGNWRAIALSMEKCIESQTTVTDIAQVKVQVDLVYGTRDPFLAPAGLRVIERMRGVATTRVDGQDHLIRPGLAQEIVRLIDNPSPPTRPIRLVNA